MTREGSQPDRWRGVGAARTFAAAMSFNPYQAPSQDPAREPDGRMRGRFMQAAIAAWLAAGFWAVMTGLIALGVAYGGAAETALILPAVLIGFYAFRGFQVWKGEVAAATALLWLHGVGGAIALFQMSDADTLVTTLNVIKLVIHVIGVVTAVRARSAPPPIA